MNPIRHLMFEKQIYPFGGFFSSFRRCEILLSQTVRSLRENIQEHSLALQAIIVYRFD